MANHVDELEDGHIVNHVEFLVEGQVGSLMNQAHEQVDTTQLTTTSNDEITESTTTNGHTSTSVPEPTDMIAANQEGTMGDISPTHNRVSPTHAQYVDEFLESISLPLQQPLIQEGFQTPHAQVVNTSQGHPHNSTQRKSTRFATQVAQDLLIRKLGDLSGEEINHAETDFDFYAQHFERPIDKSKMEAVQVLIEQGNKKLKKSSTNRKMTA
jgi:hypothetical protein